MRTIPKFLFLIACLIAVLAFSANAATFTVNTTNDTVDASPGDGNCADGSAQCSLRAALMEANALAGDDTINVPAGTYTQSLTAANEDLNAGGDWDISSNITITGAGSATTIFQAAASPGTATERVMEVTATTAVVGITGVTLRHGNKTGAVAATSRGGGIRSQGVLTMTDCIVTLNNSAGGGGIRNERTLTLNNVTVSNNVCNNGGATCFGGGIYNNLAINTTVTINNSSFTGNQSVSPGANGFAFGAGLGIEGSLGFNLVISGSSFDSNIGNGNGTGGSNGNGIRVLPVATGTISVTNTTFNNNSGTGGGASVQGVGVQLFTSGTGTLTGTFDGVTIRGNSGTTGPGMTIASTGGALTLTIRNSTISGNTSTGAAGGLLLSNSSATSGAANVVSLVNTTISGNAATGAGGGAYLESPAATGTTTLNCNFCTIAGNQGNSDNSGTDSGGGIVRASGTFNLKNSIVGDNTVGTGGLGPDIFGTVNSENYNHIEDVSGATITGVTTNNGTGDAQLGVLGNNGGPTQTQLPGGSSPVLNTIPNGTNDCGSTVTTDQRGLLRPSGSGCEKGAAEIQVFVKSRADFDGDGRTDVSVYRPSEGNWYINRSTAGLATVKFGVSTDTIVPGDFDGDQKADLAVFRPDANNANPDFYVLNSATSTVSGVSWGLAGDVPMTGDYDGDGKADFAVFRPSNATWYVLKSGGGITLEPFGLSGDTPVALDFDGDGKTNLAVYRPGDLSWYIARPTGVPAQNYDVAPFGIAGDQLVPADYDGDNKDDIAVFRPATGQWFIRRSTTLATDIVNFGASGDVPVPGDYDGDGKDDVAVYRAGLWWINRSSSGLTTTNFGLASDTAVPKRYIP